MISSLVFSFSTVAKASAVLTVLPSALASSSFIVGGACLICSPKAPTSLTG